MAKLLDKFAAPFRDSRIPFLLAEVITNGAGEMVDAVCRFSNDAAASVLNLPVEELRGKRFTRTFPAQRLADLSALQEVAFSGSCATFTYTTLLGQRLRVTCFQPMYGLAACILDAPGAAFQSQQPPGELMPLAAAVVELTKTGVRCLSFNQRLCQWTGLDRRTLLDRHAEDLSSLVEPEDWPELLQALLDAAREKRPADQDFRLLRQAAPPLWVNLRAEPLTSPSGAAAFYTVLTDVDAQRRAQARMKARLRQAETDRSLLEELLDHLPGGCCLLHQDRDSRLEAHRANRGLQELLGYSEPELLRRLSADPLWRVPAAGKGPLLEQAAQARTQGTPLRRLIQVRPKGGGLRWLSVEALWRPQPDGGYLICVFCTDATEETEALSQQQFRSQLCDLLLDRSRVLIMDYDPAQDLARIERYTAGGARVTRTVSGYLEGLPDAASIHPEDRRKLASAMRRALSRSAPDSLEYRGDYDGQGWRWHRISWSCLLDHAGSVSRLLGKVENVDRAKLAALRYQRLVGQQKKLGAGLLATARLDLTADRILDAKTGSRHLTRVLFGNTADACLRHLRDDVPDSALRQEFDRLFRREPLLDAFRQGTDRLWLEHPLTADSGVGVWSRTEVELAEDPETGHTVAFCTLEDDSVRRQREAVLEALALRDYEFLLTVDAASGLSRVYGRFRDRVPPDTAYRVLLARYLHQWVPSSKQRTALRNALRLETALEHLEAGPMYDYRFPRMDGQILQARWSWLDRDSGVLLLTGQLLPPGLPLTPAQADAAGGAS